MKVVFLEEVDGSGVVGEVKVVKGGYARNFLLPRGLAVPATPNNLQRAEKLAKADGIRQDKLDGKAHKIAEKIDGAALTFRARVGEQGRLFGSITTSDIAERLTAVAGEAIDHRQVLLGQSLRTLGAHAVRVRFTRNVYADVTATVEADDDREAAPTIEEAVAAVEAVEADADGSEAPDTDA